MALNLFLETLMTVNEIAPSCVSIVADNAQAEASPKQGLLSKSRKRTALDSSVHKEKSRWSAIALPSRRGATRTTMIERSVSDSVLGRPKRTTSPEREMRSSTNASWGENNSRSMLEPGSKKTSNRAERTRKRLYLISEAINNGERKLLPSSPDERTRAIMQRTKSLDSKLHNKNIIDLRMSESKKFQMADTPLKAGESRIKTDSLLQALGMMAPSDSKKKNSKLTSHVKSNLLRNSTTKSSSPSAAGGPREKALGDDIGSMTNLSDRKQRTTLSENENDHRIPQSKNNLKRTETTLRNAAA
jgi:hypothetical protein